MHPEASAMLKRDLPNNAGEVLGPMRAKAQRNGLMTLVGGGAVTAVATSPALRLVNLPLAKRALAVMGVATIGGYAATVGSFKAYTAAYIEDRNAAVSAADAPASSTTDPSR